MADMSKAKRRQYGTGSVYQRASDGRWLGTIEHGFHRNGTRRRVTVSAKTEAEVKRRLRIRARELEEGREADDRMTVKAWAEEWLRITERTARPNTQTMYRAAVKWAVPVIGHKRLARLTPGDIRAVQSAVRNAGNNSTTARSYHSHVRKMLKAAVEEGHAVPSNVLAVITPRAAATDRGAIPLDHTRGILTVAGGLPHGSRWLAAFLQGMRQAECLGLTWEAVRDDSLAVSWQLQALPYRKPGDRKSGFRIPDGYEVRHLERALHLVRPKSKAGWRVIPLVPGMAETLARWRDTCPTSPHGLVWPGADGSPARKAEDSREWEALQCTAGVGHADGRYYTGHEARHTTATLLMELGIPESVRIAIMGHSSMASTRGYEHVDLAAARAALAQVADRLELG